MLLPASEEPRLFLSKQTVSAERQQREFLLTILALRNFVSRIRITFVIARFRLTSLDPLIVHDLILKQA